MYDSTVWNLSQNVDRTIGSNKVDVCPCVTPPMFPYITGCGGPIVGLEALSTQGIPVDRMLLIRKVENQLVDLARNVMSTTVVGVYIIGSMVIGLRHFKKGDEEAV